MSLNVNINALRSAPVEGRPRTLSSTVDTDQARNVLLQVRSDLVGKNGAIKSGYLRIHNNKEVEGASNKEVEDARQDFLTTQGRYSGSKRDKVEAKEFITELVNKAYGDLEPSAQNELKQSLDNYFGETGDRFGTHSFVKLINALESRRKGESIGKVKSGARLITAGLEPDNTRDNRIGRAEIQYQEEGHENSVPGSNVVNEANQPRHRQVEFPKPLPAAECAQAAAAQFRELKEHLNPARVHTIPAKDYQHEEKVDIPATQDFFKHLFRPLNPNSAAQVSKSGAVEAAKPTYVLGDADGSVCRTILAAMNCGMMQLDAAGLKTLAEVMNAEAEAAALSLKDGGLEKFQSNQEISKKISDLVEHATFTEGQSHFVSIGDILHDRFSNNKQAMATLIERLHEKGAVFITGNHDVYNEVNPKGDYQKDSDTYLKENWNIDDSNTQTIDVNTFNEAMVDLNRFEAIKAQNGFYGVEQLTKQQSDALNKKCFVNAYFDKANAILYTHNGVHLAQGSVPGFESFSTGLGVVMPDMDGPESLAKKMNETPYNPAVTGKFTDFRPYDSEMQTDRLGTAATWEGRPVRLVHGHSHDHDVTGNVINVNARDHTATSTTEFSPILMVIE